MVGTHVALHPMTWFLYQAALPACALLLAGIAVWLRIPGLFAGPALTAWGWISGFVEQRAVRAQWTLFFRAHPHDLFAVTIIEPWHIAWTPLEAAAAGAVVGLVTVLLAETGPRSASRDSG